MRSVNVFVLSMLINSLPRLHLVTALLAPNLPPKFVRKMLVSVQATGCFFHRHTEYDSNTVQESQNPLGSPVKIPVLRTAIK